MNVKTKWLLGLILLAFGIPIATYMLLQRPSIPDMQESVDIQEEWKPFQKQSERISVTVSAPVSFHAFSDTTRVANGEDWIRYNMYVGQSKRGTTFMVETVDYPDCCDTSNPDRFLSGVEDELVHAKATCRIVDHYKGIFLDQPSSSLCIQHDAGYTNIRILLVDHTLVILSVTDRDQNVCDDAFKKYTSSFQFV